jgi:hypothetical protein
MGGIFGERTELIGPAEAEIWCSEVDLCSHGVVGGGCCASLKKRIKCTDSYVGTAQYKKL